MIHTLHPTPEIRSRRGALLLAGLVSVCLAFATPLAAQAPAVPAEAKKVFNKILSGVNSASGSSITGTIPDGHTANFDLKNAGSGNFDVKTAKKELKKWFDAGASGGGWTQTRVSSTSCTLERKSDKRRITIKLKKINSKYYLSSMKSGR